MLNNSDSVSSCPDDKKAVRINADGTEEPILWLEIKIGDVIRSEDGKKKRVATEKTTLGQIATGRFHFVEHGMRSTDVWYDAITHGRWTFFRSLTPPTSPFGKRDGSEVESELHHHRIEALTFVDVPEETTAIVD
ncbi:MAG TPA: hypothetical protein VJI70_00430 [Candidatus Paceibacterota bacterium]